MILSGIIKETKYPPRSNASAQAQKAGLINVGFGRWVDKDNKLVAFSSDDGNTLIPKDQYYDNKNTSKSQQKPNFEKEDGWGMVDHKSSKVRKVRDYTDKEYEEETGEYFENDFTKNLAPNAFKDKDDMIEKMRAAKPQFLSSEELQSINNCDAGEILNSTDGLVGDEAKKAMMSLGKEKAEDYGKDWDRIGDAIEKNDPVPSPMVLRDKNGDMSLLAGNTRLMSYTAHGKNIPVKIIDYEGEFNWSQEKNEGNIMKLTDLLKEAKGDKDEYQQKFRDMMSKHGIDSIDDLEDDEKDDFFNDVDDAHVSDEEELKKEGYRPRITRKEMAEVKLFTEKNTPTDKKKWAASVAAAKRKFKVYPSAYANAWAAKHYKKNGGSWRSKG